MSRPTHVERCRQWIEEQIETMATLRTANSRDLSFKSWRQNTVTVLQRIWPEDRERVERFRRISFTPPQARADGKLIREWFGKGIGESRSYLQGLLEIIDREGVPETVDGERDRDAKGLEDEVDFPMIELKETGEIARVEHHASTPTVPVGDLGVSVGYGTPDDPTAAPRDNSSPAPPSLQQVLRSHPAAERPDTEGLPPALGEAPEQPAAKHSGGGHSVVEIPRAPGLPPLPRAAEPAVDAEPVVEPDAEAPVATSDIAIPKLKIQPQAPVAKPAAEAPAASPEAAKPAARAAEPPALKPVAAEPAAKPAQGRVEAGVPRPAARGRNGKHKQKRPGANPKLRDMLGLGQFESRAEAAEADLARVVPAAPSEPAPVAKAESVAPVPVSEPEDEYEDDDDAEEAEIAEEDEEIDEETLERARMDFMQNSPIFGVVGKPVQRRTDATEFLDPDAVAVASLVADLGRLGVPDGMRPSLATRLVDVAKHLEEGTLEWSLLRGSVTDAMQYPELAKRLLPVLLPWLERAA